jgi:hypothetical protein
MPCPDGRSGRPTQKWKHSSRKRKRNQLGAKELETIKTVVEGKFLRSSQQTRFARPQDRTFQAYFKKEPDQQHVSPTTQSRRVSEIQFPLFRCFRGWPVLSTTRPNTRENAAAEAREARNRRRGSYVSGVTSNRIIVEFEPFPVEFSSPISSRAAAGAGRSKQHAHRHQIRRPPVYKLYASPSLQGALPSADWPHHVSVGMTWRDCDACLASLAGRFVPHSSTLPSSLHVLVSALCLNLCRTS